MVPLPGASALTTALCASGLPTDRFLFEGFLPAKSQERKVKLQGLRADTATLIFYEAPHRLLDALGDMLKILGDREIAIARELTKVHEEFLRGKLSEIVGALTEREIKGEIVIVIQGSAGETQVSDEDLQATIRQFAGDGMGVKEIAELLGERYGLAKKEVYKLALDLKGPKRASDAGYRRIAKPTKLLSGFCHCASTPTIRAPSGPRWHQAMSSSSFALLPSATASTEPSGRFITQPVRPNCSASCNMEAR